MTDRYDILPFVPAVPLSRQPSALAYLRTISAQQRHQLIQMPRASSGLSEHGQKLLSAKPDNLFAPVAWLWKQIGDPGFSVQMAVRAELVQRELAIFDDPRLGRANIALCWPTEKGCQHLGIPQPEKPGHQDVAHHHACNWVRMDLERRGFPARCEYPVPGDREHRADVGYPAGGTLHLCEIINKCHANLIAHLSACFLGSRSVETVTVIAFTKNHLADVRGLVAAEASLRPFAERIRFEVIEPYMRRLFP